MLFLENQMIFQIMMKLEEVKKCSHMNMLFLDGSNGNKHNNKFGIMFSEFRSRNHQLTDSWEIEPYLVGLVLHKEVFYISQPIHTPIWMVLVILIWSATFNIRIESLIGSLFTLAILRTNKRHLLELDLHQELKL